MLRHLAAAGLLALGFQTPAPATRLTGTVAGEDGKPLEGVSAVMFPADQATWTGASVREHTARVPVTGGHFEFVGLPEGSYRIMIAPAAELGGWPSAAVFERLLREGAAPVRLAAGPTRMEIVAVGGAAGLRMTGITTSTSSVVRLGGGGPPSFPGRPPAPQSTAPGSIAGRVLDPSGAGVPAVEVRCAQRRLVNGVSVLAMAGSAATTDPQGAYVLSGRPAGSCLVVALVQPNRITGVAPRLPPLEPGPDGSRLAWVATFYGDTPDESSARTVVVGTSALTGVDIHLAPLPAYPVTGSIVPAPAQPGASVFIARLDSAGRPTPLDLHMVRVNADGTFGSDGLVAGDYQLSFNGRDTWALEHVHLSGSRTEPIGLAARPNMMVSGRVELVGSSAAPATAGPSFTVGLPPYVSSPGVSFSMFPVKADLRFTVPGAGPGPFRLSINVPAPWIQVAGFVNGLDTIDVPLMPGRNADDAVIVLADHPSAFRVTVLDGQRSPVGGVSVVVFDQDPRYWNAPSRRVQTGTTLPSGSCTFSGLPPGRYFAVAFREPLPPAAAIPALMQNLKVGATAFEIAAGQTGGMQITLRPGG